MTETEQNTADILCGSDPQIRPQDDLFRHVNGKWLEETPIPADRPLTGSFVELRSRSEENIREIITELADSPDLCGERAQIAALYTSFMDEERVNSLGTDPLRGDLALTAAAKDKTELTAALGKLALGGISLPFDMEIDADRNNPEENIVWISQGGLGLPDEAFYRSAEYAQILSAYKAFVPKLYSRATGTDQKTAEDAAARITEFETKLASAHFDIVKLRDARATNNVMTFREFLDCAPGFDWESVFGTLGITKDNAPRLLICTPPALSAFARLWNESSLTDLRFYLNWQIILSRAPFLSSEITQINFDFYGRTLSGQEEQRERWKRGVSLVSSVLGEALGKIYVQRHFPASHKALMEQLVADLLSACRMSVTDLDWMGADTKRKALEKLDMFRTKIGYPDKWKDYSGLEMSAHDLMGNVRRAAAFAWQRDTEKLGRPVDRDEWHMLPQTVNAYYNPVGNEIVFPAAILQPPFFSPDADLAFNYGGIGAVIGHEICHGFDDQGAKYDGSGRLCNWWTEEDLREFEKRTASLVSQYDAYVPRQLPRNSPHHVRGALTLGENIGDLGGLSIALRAYRIALRRAGADAGDLPDRFGYTALQRVFIGFARIWREKRRDEYMIQALATDPHSPGEFRCNAVVKNMDEFARAFGITQADALYLPQEERVRIW